MAQTQEQPKKKRSNLILIGAVVFSLVICCIVFYLASRGGGDGDLPASQLPTWTPAPTNTPSPTDTPAPTLEPFAAFEQALKDVLGNSNRDVERLTGITWSEVDGVLDIQWTINDNFGNSFIMVGAQTDVTDMLEYIAKNGSPYPYQEITFDGSFPLVDQFGNVSEERVILAGYRTETIQKINWENFLYTNIFEIADGGAFIHPAMLAE